MSRRRRRTWR